MHYRPSVIVLATLLAVAACGAPDSSAPTSGAGRPASGQGTLSRGQSQLVHCTNRTAVADSGEFGPSGGTLVVGDNLLIIPPGALTDRVVIRGTVVADTVALIQFDPDGLQFRKPVGLVLDASGCDVDGYTPDIVYVDDQGQVLERIEARYSNAWHTVAAPIEHFSGYAIAW